MSEKETLNIEGPIEIKYEIDWDALEDIPDATVSFSEWIRKMVLIGKVNEELPGSAGREQALKHGRSLVEKADIDWSGEDFETLYDSIKVTEINLETKIGADLTFEGVPKELEEVIDWEEEEDK